MMEMIVLGITIVAAQAVAGIIMMKAFMSKKFIKKFTKMYVEIAEEMTEEMDI